MIIERQIKEWSEVAPWKKLDMVEQDLIIEKSLVELYKQPLVRKNLAFKGGTALNKLFITPQARFSEDIDLTLIKRIPIGETIQAVRDALVWLGDPSYKHSQYSFKLFYPYRSVSGTTIKLKVEINLTTYEQAFGLRYEQFSHESSYFAGSSTITTFELDELMGTKLRALYCRNKSRDLFDMWLVMKRDLIDLDRVIQAFYFYAAMEGNPVSRAQFEKNLYEKSRSAEFRRDMTPLLASGLSWSVDEAFKRIEDNVYPRLQGAPWKTQNQRKEK